MNLAVIPRPAYCEATGPGFTLGPGTAITVSEAAAGTDEVLRSFLAPATGLSLPLAGSRDDDRIALTVRNDDREFGEEGYRLSITAAGADLRAATRRGLLHGIQTLRQLLPPEIMATDVVRGRAWALPGARITDAPRFGWRGAHLDVARHFLPAEFLHRYLDLLALHKFSVFHLHLTDDQGWRMEIRQHPRLTEVGAWRRESMAGHPWEHRFDGTPHGGVYTQQELRDVVAHASRLGITVVPEIEVPGHCQAAIAAYPQLGNRPDRTAEVRTSWGISEDVLSPEDATISFFHDVLGEAMDVFPGPYVHVGGDECPKTAWRQSQRAQDRMRALGLADEDQLQSWFIRQMSDYLTRAGRRLLGWGEIIQGGLPPGATVVSWQDEGAGITAAGMGHDVVMAPEEYTYFDWAQSADPAEPIAIGRPGERVLPLEKVYGYEPVPAALGPGEAGRVLGTQCQLWTEYIPDERHAEYMAFPRASALAEVAWSGAGQRDWDDFLARLRVHLGRLDAMGVAYRPLSG
jgi:hexosaminidase